MLTNVSISLLCNQFRKLDVLIIQLLLADSLFRLFSHKKRKREINTHVSSTLCSNWYLMSIRYYIFLIQNEIILKKADFSSSASFGFRKILQIFSDVFLQITNAYVFHSESTFFRSWNVVVDSDWNISFTILHNRCQMSIFKPCNFCCWKSFQHSLNRFDFHLRILK